jgi:large subunit ribosomal protein L15
MKLSKVSTRKSKRLGRGYGSGKGGHTSSRGQKGQKSRGSVNILFEGVKVKKSLLHRLPLLRGKSKFKARPKAIIVNLDVLNILPDGSTVNFETLAKAGIVKLADAHKYGVKILGKGNLEKKLKIELPMSKSAQEKFTK